MCPTAPVRSALSQLEELSVAILKLSDSEWAYQFCPLREIVREL